MRLVRNPAVGRSVEFWLDNRRPSFSREPVKCPVTRTHLARRRRTENSHPQRPERRSASDGVGKVRLRFNVGKSRAGVIGLWLVAWSKILKGWEGESRQPAAGTGGTQRALYPKVVWILATGGPRKWHHRQIADKKLKGTGDKPPRRGDDDRRTSAKLPPAVVAPPRPLTQDSQPLSGAGLMRAPCLCKTAAHDENKNRHAPKTGVAHILPCAPESSQWPGTPMASM